MPEILTAREDYKSGKVKKFAEVEDLIKELNS